MTVPDDSAEALQAGRRSKYFLKNLSTEVAFYLSCG
jgi:hypothetical protein